MEDSNQRGMTSPSGVDAPVVLESRTALRNRRRVETLVVSLAQGKDRDSGFRHLFEVYDRPVFYFFANRGCSREEAHDLTQETFVRVYKGLGSYRHEGKFDAWLFSIAANVWRGHLRDGSRLKRDAQVVSLSEGEDPLAVEEARAPEAGGDPLQGVLSKERGQLLRAALDELPAQMRMCVLFRVDHELKYREIAVAMRISVDTVRSQLYKAREKLRARLRDYFKEVDF